MVLLLTGLGQVFWRDIRLELEPVLQLNESVVQEQDSLSTLSIVALVVLAIVVVLLIAALIWWLRTQGGAAIRSFYGAVRRMEQEQGTRDRYQMPWLMMLGNESDGAQLLRPVALATDRQGRLVRALVFRCRGLGAGGAPGVVPAR